ncbi:laccase [Mycena floridula]|nr:laccase [Mycena floridula]
MGHSPSLMYFVALALLASRTLAAIGPSTDITISNANVAPDGFTRSASLVQGVVDTALITGQKGDTFSLNVINNLDSDGSQYQSTSIVRHGIFQTNTTWADGAAFVSQCPIAKSNSFLYEFTVKQAGTFWYHSHLATQYCDGVRGPLVVYDPADPHLSLYDVDDDTTIITLSDWYHTVSQNAGAVPTPDSILINGLGRYSGATTSPLSVISVAQGKRYRMRLINMSCDPNYLFQIDGHTSLTVIEVDGVSHQPLVVDEIQIFAGQRYSFILNANATVGNYWIRAKPNRAASTTFTDGLNMAILRYVGAAVAEPTTTQDTATNLLKETALIPLTDVAAPGTAVAGGADQVLNLAIGSSGAAFTINGVSFTPPSVPVLLQILSGAQSASSLLPSGSVYALQPNAVIELSIPAGGPGTPHPFHLHGHTFSVVRSAGSTVYNYANPPQRDVVSTGTAGDNVTIRFVTDNHGPWFLHCHIDWHLDAGLAVVFAEDSADWATANPVPDAWNDLCPIYNALDPSDL